MTEVVVWVMVGSLVLMSLSALACAIVSVCGAVQGRRSSHAPKKAYGSPRAASDASAAKYTRAREFIAFKAGGGDDD